MSRDGNGGDSLDQAAELQDVINRKGIDAAAQRAAPQSHPDFDGSHCLDCEGVIPSQRLLMGRIRCVSCQGIFETPKRGYSR